MDNNEWKKILHSFPGLYEVPYILGVWTLQKDVL